MDAVHVYCNYKAKRVVMEDEVASTNIYKVLANLEDLQFDRIQSSLEKKDKASGFISAVKEVEPNVDYIETAVLYLLYKDKLRDGLTVPDSNFLKYSKEFGKEFVIAVYLLGIFLKYDKTYDCYYDSLSLPMFKQKNDCDTNAPYVLPKFPCKMHMLTDKGKPSKAKGAIKTVGNEDEYLELINNSTKKWFEEKTDTALW